MLHDNCNGTFTILGLYDERRPGHGGAWPTDPPSLPTVVSQNSPSASATRQSVSPFKPNSGAAKAMVASSGRDPGHIQQSPANKILEMEDWELAPGRIRSKASPPDST